MKNEVWEKVEQIFHTALDLSAEERKPFLRRECAGDAALLSEVESLVHSFEKEADFLDEPVFELGLGALHKKSHKNLSGSTIGFYRLQKQLGAGGMGEVYLATDTRLNRRVALKFLTDSLENDRAAKRRLIREAQAVAMLEHPNICAIYGIEQTESHNFIVMPYLEGRTLAETIEREAFGVDEVKSLARQIVTAVAFAHSHGVIHRDLKPGNIMLSAAGEIKVLDFGLAKVVRQTQIFERDAADTNHSSNSEAIIGTVSYMSPEQLRGERPDFCSDIFSIGVVLYELMAKKTPFSRESKAETIAAILSEETPALKDIVPDFPASLTNLVEKCLEKKPADRFQSAAEMLVELDNAEAENLTVVNSQRRRRFFTKAVLAAAVLLAVLAIIFFYNTDRPQRTVAILPISFDNPPLEKEYLADGLTQSIIDKLSNLSDLKVKSEYIVSRYKGKTIEPQTAGKELNADAVFIGAIIRRGNELFLATKLIRTSDGILLDTAEVKIEESNLIELQENISARIAGKIKSNLTDDDKNKLAKRDTENEEAKRLYLLGRLYLGRRQTEDLKIAERYFREAVNLDPGYAKAWAGLADTYTLFSVPGYKGAMPPDEAVKAARVAAKTALGIDDGLCEPYVSLGMIKLKYEWDWDGAEDNFRAALSRNPEFPPAHSGLTTLLVIEERYEEALEAARKTKEFAPFSVSSDLGLIGVYFFKRDYEQMKQAVSEALENFPNHKRLTYFRGLQLLETDKLNEAAEIFEKMYGEDKVLAAAPLGFIYGKMGRKHEALKILSDLEELSKKDNADYIPAQEKAIIYLGLGETKKVFENLKKACEERFPSLPFVVSDPIFDEIKSDAGFAAVRKCVNR